MPKSGKFLSHVVIPFFAHKEIVIAKYMGQKLGSDLAYHSGVIVENALLWRQT